MADHLAAEIAEHRPSDTWMGMHGPACDVCHDEDWPCLVRRLADERARYRAALEHIASFDRKALDMAKTLHYDMNGWAKRALEQPAPEREG